MTARINKSAVIAAGIGQFDVVVAAHAHEMKAWREHMGRVAADEKNGVTGIERHWPLARPSSHPLVEAAVNENCEPDFEIEDDGPTPDQVLREKKNKLISGIALAERAAIDAVVPPGKRRLYNLQESDIRQEDAKADQSGVIASIASAVGLGRRQGMPSEHERFLFDQAARRDRIDAITRAAAQAMHDVEDLTDQTILAWQMPDLTK